MLQSTGQKYINEFIVAREVVSLVFFELSEEIARLVVTSYKTWRRTRLIHSLHLHRVEHALHHVGRRVLYSVC
jgi:hypothetical protein